MKAERFRRNNSNAAAPADLHLDDALSAARDCLEEELCRVKERTQDVAYQAITRAPVNNKLDVLATHLGMWGREIGEIASRWLQEYLKLGIANQAEISGNLVDWAILQVHQTLFHHLLDDQSVVDNWIKFACDGDQTYRTRVCGSSSAWGAPSWMCPPEPLGLLPVSPTSVVFIFRLDESQTETLLKKLVRIVRFRLDSELGRGYRLLVIRNAQSPSSNNNETKTSQKRTPKGFEGLRDKHDLSRYMVGANLTNRQHDCFSLSAEYGLTKPEIARRLNLRHHSTVAEHIAAATKKITLACQTDRVQKRKATRVIDY